jgi:putative hydrolase of the HAD superfamily
VIRCVLVDAVGTLLELRRPVPEVYAETARRCGLAADPAEIARRLAGVRIGPPSLRGVPLQRVPELERAGWREVVRAALGSAAADGACFERLWAHYARSDAWRAVDGAAETLAAVRAAGRVLGVVSNMDARLPGVLEGLGLAALFEVCVLPSSCGLAKPDPRIFRVALERAGCEAAQALYVGDREPDCVAAARAAGLRAVRFAPRGGPGDLRRWADLPGFLAGAELRS